MAARREHADLTVNHPVYDDAGILQWTDEVEDVFRRNEATTGKCSVLVNGSAGLSSAVLMGLNRPGLHRLWVIRAGIYPGEGDSAHYSIDFHYAGEDIPQKMYPRLPYHDRVCGSLRDYRDIGSLLDSNFTRIDGEAEQVYALAVSDTKKHMAGVMADYLSPKPWWKFW